MASLSLSRDGTSGEPSLVRLGSARPPLCCSGHGLLRSRCQQGACPPPSSEHLPGRRMAVLERYFALLCSGLRSDLNLPSRRCDPAVASGLGETLYVNRRLSVLQKFLPTKGAPEQWEISHASLSHDHLLSRQGARRRIQYLQQQSKGRDVACRSKQRQRETIQTLRPKTMLLPALAFGYASGTAT